LACIRLLSLKGSQCENLIFGQVAFEMSGKTSQCMRGRRAFLHLVSGFLENIFEMYGAASFRPGLFGRFYLGLSGVRLSLGR